MLLREKAKITRSTYANSAMSIASTAVPPFLLGTWMKPSILDFPLSGKLLRTNGKGSKWCLLPQAAHTWVQHLAGPACPHCLAILYTDRLDLALQSSHRVLSDHSILDPMLQNLLVSGMQQKQPCSFSFVIFFNVKEKTKQQQQKRNLGPTAQFCPFRYHCEPLLQRTSPCSHLH